MALFNRMTEIAIENGKTASEFSLASQKNANATWGYGIIGGVVLYFFSWEWSIAPFILALYSAFQSISATSIATNIEGLSSDPTKESDARIIINAYGLVLETNVDSTLGGKFNEQTLPYPREAIQVAINTLLSMGSDIKQQDILKGGLIMLEDFISEDDFNREKKKVQ